MATQELYQKLLQENQKYFKYMTGSIIFLMVMVTSGPFILPYFHTLAPESIIPWMCDLVFAVIGIIDIKIFFENRRHWRESNEELNEFLQTEAE